MPRLGWAFWPLAAPKSESPCLACRCRGVGGLLLSDPKAITPTDVSLRISNSVDQHVRRVCWNSTLHCTGVPKTNKDWRSHQNEPRLVLHGMRRGRS